MAKKTKVVSIVFIDPDSKPGVKIYLFMNTYVFASSVWPDFSKKIKKPREKKKQKDS